MIGMKFRSIRPLLASLIVLMACSTPSEPFNLAESTNPNDLTIPRSGLWATKVFATFPTFIDEASSSQPALAPEQTMLENQPKNMTPNPIMSECSGIAWFADGRTQSTPWKSCSTGFNPKDLLEWFKSWPR
jgi:hypothetical protein